MALRLLEWEGRSQDLKESREEIRQDLTGSISHDTNASSAIIQEVKMRIGEIRTLAGPNVFSHSPVLIMKLFLDDLTERESFEIEGFNERLLNLLPGVNEHHCAKGRPGGFVERLAEGTYFGHVVEHAALELTELAGVPVFHGKTRNAGETGVYHVIVEYKAEQATKYLLETAVELVEALIRDESFPLEQRVEKACSIAAKTELGPSTK